MSVPTVGVRMECRKFSRNLVGKDYLVGDIHGQFWKLSEALECVSFDAESDRLFTVGDLCDRGPESELAITWLSKPYFHSVLGNHEQLIIRYFENENSVSTETMIKNGAAWFIYLSRLQQQDIVSRFLELPLAIEIELNRGRKAGIVHASCPTESWDTFMIQIEKSEIFDAFTNSALWNSNRYRDCVKEPIAGVEHVFVGHISIHLPHEKTAFGNVIHTDCFGWSGRRPFILYDVETGSALYNNE
ncbi:MAG: serine/threonine protein phosphatase [Gammaproteobacteria bacterium]|nr:MAG: serine/threonine protein phosphatase [Gammaproteobacteria bacterium]